MIENMACFCAFSYIYCLIEEESICVNILSMYVSIMGIISNKT